MQGKDETSDVITHMYITIMEYGLGVLLSCGIIKSG
jgi:hypothetical protein